jgi:membrane-associated phospholipid phosphatase
MTIRQVCIAGAVLALLTVLCVFTIDGPVAAMVKPNVASSKAIVNPAVHVLEILFAFELSKFVTGFAILIAGLVLFAFARHRRLAWLLTFVGAVHLVARLLAGVLKNVFLRLRPYETLDPDRFFVDGGSSFPSGHAVHFWALFFALALAFPRLRWAALTLALFVSTARVVVNDHFVSDTLGSAAIAAFVCCLFAWMLRRASNAAR